MIPRSPGLKWRVYYGWWRYRLGRYIICGGSGIRDACYIICGRNLAFFKKISSCAPRKRQKKRQTTFVVCLNFISVNLIYLTVKYFSLLLFTNKTNSFVLYSEKFSSINFSSCSK